MKVYVKSEAERDQWYQSYLEACKASGLMNPVAKWEWDFDHPIESEPAPAASEANSEDATTRELIEILLLNGRQTTAYAYCKTHYEISFDEAISKVTAIEDELIARGRFEPNKIDRLKAELAEANARLATAEKALSDVEHICQEELPIEANFQENAYLLLNRLERAKQALAAIRGESEASPPA